MELQDGHVVKYRQYIWKRLKAMKIFGIIPEKVIVRNYVKFLKPKQLKNRED